MAHQVSLLPAVTLISQLFFVTFFGFLGLLLALPLTVVGMIWFREVLLEDILDQWGRNDKRETKIVFVTESAETASLPSQSQENQDNPNADEATKGEK
jgi:hypothetical protein